MVNVYAKHLPDLDIAMNALDQPRVVVPWDDLQEYLQREESSRTMPLKTANSFSAATLSAGEPS